MGTVYCNQTSCKYNYKLLCDTPTYVCGQPKKAKFNTKEECENYEPKSYGGGMVSG